MSSTSDKHTKTESHLIQIQRRPGLLLLAVVIIILGALAVVFFVLPKGDRINQAGYQVVYLTSGQAYFGKLQNTNGEYLFLKEPYTAQDVTPDGERKPEGAETSTTLLKVTKQQYGPEDAISLKSNQVLFWQNLRDDSKVSKAIEDSNE